MPVAAIYDIHGNLPALEAVCAEIRRSRIGRIVVGGDVVPGPLAAETVAYLQSLDIPAEYIVGNGEVATLDVIGGKVPAGVPLQFRPIFEWTVQQLAPDQAAWLATWPKTLRVEIAGQGPTLFCHATPRDENEIFTRMTPDERLRPIFECLDVSTVVCGHTHMQFDRKVGRVRVINAGSVGMPFGEPGAYWLLLGSDVQLRHTAYDLPNAAERIRRSGYPMAEVFAANNVLRPPTEDAMLAAFERS